MTHTKRPFKLLPNIPHVILCEGRDEEMFLRYYIEYLVNKKLVPDTFNIINLGGNEEMRKTLHLFPSLDYFDQMKGFLLVRPSLFNKVWKMLFKFLLLWMGALWKIKKGCVLDLFCCLEKKGKILFLMGL